jgi:RNA polymerase sigma factor (sigma-70 family)
VLASLVGFLGDMDLAEEAAQEAFAIAAERWPRDGTPQHPVAWLVATGRNRAIDRVRRERTLRDKTRLLGADRQAGTMDEIDPDQTTIPDERLELIFTCCHPALAVEAQVALTLRALGGLTTEEIARAFLVSEETMKRRLTRAKAKIKATAIPFAVPADGLLPDRLAAALAVVYLIFNQGYTDRGDLAAEAIRLGRLLAELMPDEPEVYGLLALMLLHDSRRQARVVDGQLVPLAEQDRSRHDRAKVPGRSRCARAGAGAGAAAGRRPVRTPGGDRLAPGPSERRLGRGRDALRTPRAADPLAGGRSEPRGSGRRGGRARPRARDRRLARHEPSCCTDWAATKKRGRRSSAPCGWPRPTPSADSSPAGWQPCDQARVAARRQTVGGHAEPSRATVPGGEACVCGRPITIAG